MSKTILHFGEILWDQFPDYKRAGGSPFNVSMHLHYLKHHSYLISAVGRDDSGSELLDIIHQKDGDRRFIRRLDYPTGTVDVQMNTQNQPEYIIHKKVAWDFIQPPEDLDKIASTTDAFTFATLAQRSSTNRISLQKIIADLPISSLRFLDVNLRPPFVQKPVIDFSLGKSDYVKMNEQEWKEIREMLQISKEIELLDRYEINGLILTLGAEGSVYFDKERHKYIEPAASVDPKKGDLVGVGDAFWACFIHHTLKKTPWRQTLVKSNQYAGWVAEQKGGIPDPDESILESVM